MFEAHVLNLLRKYLGEYVHGLSPEALRISVWKGDVVLKDLKLKAEALNSLRLPVTVKAGFVGTITLKVPWKRLGKEPVIVLIDRVFLLAHPVVDQRSLKEEDLEKLFLKKLQQIEEAESATLEARSKIGTPAAAGNSWLGSLIAIIIGNLKTSISNVHIRYEDSFSNPGHPFSFGVTLAKLAAVTVDERGNETFDASGALDKLRKSLQLDRLAMYHNSDRDPWKLDKKWEDLSPEEWIKIFEEGIKESKAKSKVASVWARDRNFLVAPINGALKYHRLGNEERVDPNVPFEKASLYIKDVSLTITEAQYHDWIRLVEVISRYKTYVEVSHLRPMVPVSQGVSLWWRYAAQAGLQQKKMCLRFSWDKIQHLCHLRRRYVQLYANVLQQSSIDYPEIREIEKDLDPKVILLWRFLAHAKVEYVKSKEAAEQKMLRKGSWLPFRRSSSLIDVSTDKTPDSPHVDKGFTQEEWEEINKLLSFQPDEDQALLSGKKMQNMIRFLVHVSITRAAARIINISQTEIICGRFDNLNVSVRFKQRTTSCDLTLKFCGLSSPEGSLAESVSSEQKSNALAAHFVHSPIGENVDWRLSAKTSPCHVTIFMESYNRFLEFVKRSSAVSPVALETATALQHKIEMVTRKAQEQIQTVLEEQSRFALDIDLDAPKVRIPMRASTSSKCESHFLVDFGHFTLRTKDDHDLYDHSQSMYSRFYISGEDIAAFFTICGCESESCSLVCQPSMCLSLEDDDNILSLIDRCGMAVIVDKIKVEHPSYPSTCLSVEVPSLGIHISPARYCRLMELLNILCGTLPDAEEPSVEVLQAQVAPWSMPDLATEARILKWKGIGYSVAAWKPCFLVLTGLHLYVLESETSHSYERHASMAGKQVFEVPLTNVGGSPFCLAISARGMDVQKALESFSTLIIEFHDEEAKSTWLKGLIQATYRASDPSSIEILGVLNDKPSDITQGRIARAKAPDLIVSGTLKEIKLSLYGMVKVEGNGRSAESPIIELLAYGGKVHVSHCAVDLTVKVKLHSLKIKDELYQAFCSGVQYLAYSVVSDQQPSMHDDVSGEDDEFKDAFQDFMSEVAIHGDEVLKGRCVTSEVFYEAQGFDDADFISLTFLKRAPDSPDYDGIDTQISISMSKLEFFCNRPTLVALIKFGLDLNSRNSGDSSLTSDEKVADNESSVKIEATHGGDAFVKGLLGYGKGRVIFDLNMNVDSVTVFLNKEDGSQLAMLVQESFLLDVKIYPTSISIEGILGNFRLCDMSLGPDHSWGWLCDIRNQGAESLIQFTFKSYSKEDDDYEGYDYSLSGRLSAVRIVFLYRFIQEVTSYFMELATPHAVEVINLVDKVGGIEWLIRNDEIQGGSAIKIDLHLDTPIIIVPRNSQSKDFMQLDLGQLQVKNEFHWYGGTEKDPSAVHLDILDAEILGMNLAVGVNGRIGKPMIREGKDIHIYVRRSLRDIFRKVPNFTLEAKVGLLHGVMSDKEYNVILNCFVMNLCEQPSLPPSFRGGNSVSEDTIKLLTDKMNANGQVLLSRTVNVIAVEMNYALLELCNGVYEVSPLAQVSLEGVWVSYRMTSLSESDLYVTIPKLSFVDIRSNTKPEMSLMIGSCTDVPTSQIIPQPCVNLSNSTMFLMDCRWRVSSQSCVLRVQQPRILVVPDFLLAVCEYFVPAVGTITGREERMNPKNDPILKNYTILLSTPLYKQKDDIIHLSPNRQLIADNIGVNDYVYDGCGKIIILSDENQTKGIQPIIIIGRGKSLRFVNVKIENGFLLRKYAYLSSDSSYSVSKEDGVEITFMENIFSGGGNNGEDDMEESSQILGPSELVHDESIAMRNFSFEAQVVSPEFTFYDSTKSYVEDSSHSEKLLRAKMDFSFMYASKENDAWIRGHLKDLTIEAGSGLMILDPVDISGGYTCIKDKTNMSLTSTEIYIHLSLGVISLVLNLQTQAAAALQFGNDDPLSPCTDFYKIWVSPKENGRNNKITFWRPRAPSNYVILGDCVTSRENPPSQVVVAINNVYGRVRRPFGFKLIGRFSSIEELEGVDGDCSLWLPIAPPGYVAIGCVAHPGNKPPPLQIVHCIRSDLVTSTFLECIFNVPPNPSFLSGFSIWRVDNVLVSFYAHSSYNCPPKGTTFDLNYLLLWNSSWSRSKESTSENEQTTTSSSSLSSGSIPKATRCCMSTPNFERIWWDKGGDYHKQISIWRPIASPSFAILGDCITEGLEPPPLGITFKADHHEISAKPVQFTKVAHIGRKFFDEAFFWYPIAPPGYASLGCIVTGYDDPPRLELVCCPRMDLVSEANTPEMPLLKSLNSKPPHCWSIWKVENQACTFLARSDLKKPSSRLAFTIGDSSKPKTKDKMTADLKIRSFSLSLLDNFCGMMTPLFDATITNIKLSTHGRLNSMNAELVSSIAASSFNTQLEAWEPLVEPFDGILKFEIFDTNLHPPSRLGKRVRVSATSILNINLSSANIETLVQATTSWKRQRELDQKALKLIEEARGYDGLVKKTTFSAMDENDFQKIILENKLGCDIYLKKADKDSDTVELLRDGDIESVLVPPPRYSDRLNVANESRDRRRYVALHIVEAKGLPVVDDGNSHNFFCALRMVTENQDTDQQKIFPQNARTKCVKPLMSAINGGSARWNEIFIFEVPLKGISKLEVEVTNLAAKAGKGEIVGASSFSVGVGASALKKVSSLRMLSLTSDVQDTIWYPLRRRGQSHATDDAHSCGSLSVSTCFFERKTTLHSQTDKDVDEDVGFWVGLSPGGAWESFRPFLPLSVITKPLSDDVVALEVYMKEGKKHATFRGLATVINDSNIKLDIFVCPESNINTLRVSSETTTYTNNDNNIIIEEIFEKQRYHPAVYGWTNNHPGRWSTRDYSYSSIDFFEPPLPPGWTWTTGWSVDKSEFVDNDGWAYGVDYDSLKWPLTCTKSATISIPDAVRQRRWTRTRQQVNELITRIVDPDSSTVLPWRSMSVNANQCLQVRPHLDDSQISFAWGCLVTLGHQHFADPHGALTRQNTLKSKTQLPVSAFRLNQLEKRDVLLSCPGGATKQFWLSIATDASVLPSELGSPVYDWKITITSPLKLENRLPCPAQFTVKDGNGIDRHHGCILSREIAHIFAADIQNPIYVMLIIEGGWVVEKDTVLVLDLINNNHVSSFWMVNQQQKRRLRVSIDRDMGGTPAAPKTIRFFVPYWLSNDSFLSLTYRVVETEPPESAEIIPPMRPRRVNSARASLKSISNVENGSRQTVQVLEAIEDTSPIPCMFSPQDYIGNGGIMLFSSRNDAYLSPRVGIAVAMKNSEKFSPGISLLELEKKQRIDVMAFGSDGTYYKLSALLHMTADRTKVVHFQPHTMFINRVGFSVCLQQPGTLKENWIHPTDPPKQICWQGAKGDMLQLHIDGYEWSRPFSVGSIGVMSICLNNETGSNEMYVKVKVRSGMKCSRYEVIFRPNSFSSPYRIENRSLFIPVRFRQAGGNNDSWKLLQTNVATSFLWEDLGRERMLQLHIVDGMDPIKYNIDEITAHHPIILENGRGLSVTILKEMKMNVVKIDDWIREDNDHTLVVLGSSGASSSLLQQQSLSSDCEFHLIVEVGNLGLSVIDHTPEEILYFSMQNLLLTYSTGLGSGVNRFKITTGGIQVDNQLPLTSMPVLFRPQRIEVDNEHIIFKLSITQISNGSLDLCVYPYIGFQGPEDSAFLINIHEPIIWRLHEMIQQVNPSRLFDNQTTTTTSVSVDPIIEIGVLNISEVRFKLSLGMSPTQRPVGVFGFWSSLMTALGSTENMPVRINPRFLGNVSMRYSVLTGNAISNIKKDLLGQPLQLLSGVDILGNASSALGHMSKGVAALSMDKKFIRSRQRQGSRSVEDFGDIIREGGGALAKGLFRGVTGILTKPLEGAKASGVEGFVQGVGKGLIGAAAQPVSGVLDLLSKTTEGANAFRMKIASAIASEDQLLRRRLPRVISDDNLLCPYDHYKAQGQVILQLAESGSFLAQVRGKFALTDVYQDHFPLPKARILILTNRRVILLQQNSHLMSQKKFNPAREPCSVIWDVLWEHLVSIKLAHGKKDQPNAPPSRLVLHLDTKTIDPKDHVRVIKCKRDANQATKVHTSINQAITTYCTTQTKGLPRRKVTKPYAPPVKVVTYETIPSAVSRTTSFGSTEQ